MGFDIEFRGDNDGFLHRVELSTGTTFDLTAAEFREVKNAVRRSQLLGGAIASPLHVEVVSWAPSSGGVFLHLIGSRMMWQAFATLGGRGIQAVPVWGKLVDRLACRGVFVERVIFESAQFDDSKRSVLREVGERTVVRLAGTYSDAQLTLLHMALEHAVEISSDAEPPWVSSTGELRSVHLAASVPHSLLAEALDTWSQLCWTGPLDVQLI